MLIERGQAITAIQALLLKEVTDLKLVKPYSGELDRYSKKTQLKEETFPAMVNLTTPFALIISKGRFRLQDQRPSLKFKHEISIYIGDANRHDFQSTTVPNVITLLDKCVKALHGVVLLKGCGALTVENDGEYLITTDLFTIYDQKYYQYEIGS